MQPKQTKNKKSYFNSPKKEPLVKKMIFDPNEAVPPQSCFDLRPINQNQSNQQEIIFEPKSSSLKEISDFQKHSPHEFDKIIYGLNQNHSHNENMFLHPQRSNQYSHQIQKQHYVQDHHQNYSQNSNSLKRDASFSPEQIKKYENVVKIFQIFDEPHQSKQRYYRITSQKNDLIKKQVLSSNYQAQFFEKKTKKRTYKSKQKHKQNSKEVKLEEFQSEGELKSLEWPNQSVLSTPKMAKVFAEKQQKTVNRRNTVRKVTENAEFQLVNEFTELMSYASLIQDMITIYDRSPLFESPLDFDSEPEETNQQEINGSSRSIKEKQNFQENQSIEVKVQQNSMDMQDVRFDSQSSISLKNQKQCFTMLDKMRIDQASQKNKKTIIKEIKFQRSKTYLNFYEPIQQLKPYIKKMSLEEKKIFLAFKKELKQIKDIIEYFDKKKNNEKRQHICKICGQQFDSGRQLGGHMSRKHPGKALQYIFKKELRKVKEIERNRRKYFKNQKKDLVKQEDNFD